MEVGKLGAVDAVGVYYVYVCVCMVAVAHTWRRVVSYGDVRSHSRRGVSLGNII